MDSDRIQFNFSNTYARLPERFYVRLDPTPVLAPRLVKLNVHLALKLGLDPERLATPEGIAILAGNAVPEGAEPMALAYAGHQFGHFVPQLGDGRANLLGEVVGDDGIRYDIQLKGSGVTPFSRRGDGRAALGPVLREYLVSEAMAALGLPTTRALAAVTTGERVFRETVLPGAVFTRVAASHLRVGTFQYFANQDDIEALKTLVQYAIKRHYPEAGQSAHPVRAFLDGVVDRQARLVAQWMMLGFVHGVMNTDNTSISGETIDYGPCAFLEAYDPATTFSSIDQRGRYSYGKQPHAMQWNLLRLAETLLPLLEIEAGSQDAAVDSARQSLSNFATVFEAARVAGLRRKLGLVNEQDGDATLGDDLLNRMAANQADFTLTFRRLALAAEEEGRDTEVRVLFADPSAYDVWAQAWRRRLALEGTAKSEISRSMLLASPAFIPRNHLVEAAIVAAVERQNFAPFEKLLEIVTNPFTDQPEWEDYTLPALPHERVLQTFCGT
jgi:uncharacterized protein YdiU (UPF0061 family)